MKNTNKSLVSKILLMIIITLISIFAIQICTTYTYASTQDRLSANVTSRGSADDLPIISDPNSVYKPNNEINSITSKILGAVTPICYAAAVIIVLIKGVQIMKAAPDEKAKISEQMIGVVIGAAILFAMGTIVGIVARLSQKIV